MIRFTYVARVMDGLMLVASVDGGGSGMEAEKGAGKQIIRSLGAGSPRQCTFESGDHCFHYLIENNTVYLVLTHKNYPKRMAFLYLAELHGQFARYLEQEHGPEWQQQLATVDRPYAYIHFDKHIQRLRKEFSDPSASPHATSQLSADLNDVTNIMRKNIQDVLDRGERLNEASSASRRLVDNSKIFHSGAKHLNRLAFWRKWAPVAGGVAVVVFFLYLRMYVL